MLGKILKFSQHDNNIIVKLEKKDMIISYLNNDTIHIFESEASKYHSFAVTNASPNNNIKVIKKENTIEITFGDKILTVSDDFHLEVKKDFSTILKSSITDTQKKEKIDDSILSLEGHQRGNDESLLFKISTPVSKTTSFYGLGDKTGYLNKRGYEYENWNTDNPDPHMENFRTLYKSIPFCMISDQYTYGLFQDNTYKSVFNFAKENDEFFFGAVDGYINYYLFFGSTLKSIIGEYTFLTGRFPLPSIWTLGNQQSRWSYSTKKEVMDLALKFKEEKIPLDVIHLDIDYMEEYAVFTTDHHKFPDFAEMIKNLKDMGIKIVTIIDPGVKAKEGYHVYDEGIENNFFATKDNKTYHNAVWPGDSVFPSFTSSRVRNWWGNNTKILTDLGVSGIWNDMNEPASFNGPLPLDVMFEGDDKNYTHKECHNIYGHNMCQATYEGLAKNTNKRPFIITRACYSGTNRYSTVWTGDNHSLWPHLEMAIPQMCNIGMSGFPFMGTDIGGFGSDCTPELMARWIQVGIFSPLCRNHSAYGTRRQEPWVFGKETTDIYRKFVELRYKLIPYIYDLFYQHQNSGLPIIRPLVLEYQDDENVKSLNDEFMLGSNILVSPVVKQGQRKKLVYLPEGNWIDFENNQTFSGNQYIIYDAPLDVCPIFIKEGSIIPTYPVKDHIDNEDELNILIYGDKAKYIHYQDNGENFDYKDGKYNLYLFEYNNKFDFNFIHKGYQEYKKINPIKIK